MKFIIATQEFNYLVSKCCSVIPGRPAVPILSNILIEVTGNQLTLTATDLTVGICCFTEVKVLEEGATTLPGKKLTDLANELIAINTEVSTNAQEITQIISGASKFKLNGMDKSEYPSLPSIQDAIKFSIKQSHLRDAFSRTAFAVARDENRYILTGICLKISNGYATFAGTDGKRLARITQPINLDRSFSGSYVIPSKAIDEFIKNLNDDGDATVALMNDKIAVTTSTTMVISKLMSGEYPDVNRLIPEKSDIDVTIHREELITLLRQVSLFTSDESHAVRFSFSDGELRLSVDNVNMGEGRVSMPVNYRGSRFDIAFNPKYFLDILRHTKEEVVQMSMNDPYNPGIIHDNKTGDADPSRPESLFVLMPLRLDG